MNNARGHRLSSLLLALFLVLGLLLTPLGVRRASAAAYDEAMEKLSEWGVLNGYADGELHPERLVTRAQFVAMINRAYGYSELSSETLPFRDVLPSAWYYDDISIAYNLPKSLLRKQNVFQSIKVGFSCTNVFHTILLNRHCGKKSNSASNACSLKV